MNGAMKTFLLLVSILCASACGGGGSKPATTPEPTPEPTTTETTTETTTQTTPASTAEQTPPAGGEQPAEPPAPDPKETAMQAELAAYETAKPVFEKFCINCHQKGKRGATKKALAELDITEYPFKGEHANGPDIRKALGIGGGKPTMPRNKPGSVKGDDLAAITAWLDAWDAAEAAGAHAK